MKKRVVLHSVVKKVMPYSIFGVLVGFLFSLIGKFGMAAFVAGGYATLMLPRPFVALLIFIGSIPFSIKLIGFISASMALGFVILVVTIIYFLVNGLKIYFDPLHVLVAGIIFLASISVLYGSAYTDDQRYLSHGLTELRRYWLVAILYVLPFVLVSTIRQIKQIMWVIVISCTLLSIIMMLQVNYEFIIPGFENEDSGVFEFDRVGDQIRAGGTTAHPVLSAVMLQIAFIMSFFLLMAEKSPARRLILILTTFLILPFGWKYSFARASMVALILTIPYAMFKLRGKLTQRTITMALVAIFLVLAIGPLVIEKKGSAPFIERFKTIFKFTEDVAYRWRVDMITTGINMFEDRPLFGVGVGNYRFTYMKYLRPDHVKEEMFHPGISCEITYITFLTEMGAIGLLMFVLMLGLTLRNLSKVGNWYSQKGDSSDATIIMGLEVAFWSIIMVNFGGAFEFLKYLWLFVGLSAVTKRIMLNSKMQERI